MANFLIMRMAKLKSGGAVSGMSKHNFRDIDTPNADPEKLLENDHRACTSVAETMAKYNSLLPEKVRKNAIHAIDYLITTSPEASKKDNKIAIEEGIKWVTEKHGAENVLLSSVHHDETTPHVHILVMPLKDGKLNAKHFVGGHRDRLKEMQTEFFSQVQSAGASLERGVEGSRAKHQSTKRWAAKQAALGEAIKTPSKNVLQSRVELTRLDFIRPEKANLRVSEVLAEVVSQREDALTSVAAHKVEFERNKNELAGLRQANNKGYAQLLRLRDIKVGYEESFTDPTQRDRMIEFLTDLKRKAENVASKLNKLQGRVADQLARSFSPSAAHGVERRGAQRTWGTGRERSAAVHSGVLREPTISKSKKRDQHLSLSQ